MVIDSTETPDTSGSETLLLSLQAMMSRQQATLDFLMKERSQSTQRVTQGELASALGAMSQAVPQEVDPIPPPVEQASAVRGAVSQAAPQGSSPMIKETPSASEQDTRLRSLAEGQQCYRPAASHN